MKVRSQSSSILRKRSSQRRRVSEAHQGIAFVLILHQHEQSVGRELHIRYQSLRIDLLDGQVLSANEKFDATFLHFSDWLQVWVCCSKLRLVMLVIENAINGGSMEYDCEFCVPK